jgi:hypothetical protein
VTCGNLAVKYFQPFLISHVFLKVKTQIESRTKADNSAISCGDTADSLCAKCNQQQQALHSSITPETSLCRLFTRAASRGARANAWAQNTHKVLQGLFAQAAAPFGKQTQSARGARSHKFDWGQFLWNNKHSSACVRDGNLVRRSLRVCALDAASFP